MWTRLRRLLSGKPSLCAVGAVSEPQFALDFALLEDRVLFSVSPLGVAEVPEDFGQDIDGGLGRLVDAIFTGELNGADEHDHAVDDGFEVPLSSVETPSILREVIFIDSAVDAAQLI